MSECSICGGEKELALFRNNETGVEVEKYECLKCGRLTTPCEVVKRVCGYLTPLNRWNKGKFEEQKHRKTYDKALGIGA